MIVDKEEVEKFITNKKDIKNYNYNKYIINLLKNFKNIEICSAIKDFEDFVISIDKFKTYKKNILDELKSSILDKKPFSNNFSKKDNEALIKLIIIFSICMKKD